MRMPFRPKPRKRFVITFTQDIDLEAVAAGKPGIFAGGVTLECVCSCGGKSNAGPTTITTPRSVLNTYTCRECGDKVDVVFTADLKQPEAVFDTDKGGEVLDWRDEVAKQRAAGAFMVREVGR